MCEPRGRTATAASTAVTRTWNKNGTKQRCPACANAKTLRRAGDRAGDRAAHELPSGASCRHTCADPPGPSLGTAASSEVTSTTKVQSGVPVACLSCRADLDSVAGDAASTSKRNDMPRTAEHVKIIKTFLVYQRSCFAQRKYAGVASIPRDSQ
jgi:hypothetical protein